MVQNGKNACEMVEIDQVEEERSTYVYSFFWRFLSFFATFLSKRILENLSENIELKLLSRGISFFYQTMAVEEE